MLITLDPSLGDLLTISCPLLINQDLGDRSSDQAVPSILLNSADDVESNLTAASFGVVGASFVVMQQEGVDQDAGFFWRNSYME